MKREREQTQEAPAFDLTVAEVLDAAPDAFFALDRDWRVLYLNPAAEQLLDRRAAELVGRDLWTEFPDAVGSTFFVEYQRAMRDGVTVAFTEFYPPLDRWFAVQAVPQSHGLSVHFHDVTSLKLAEERSSRLAAMHAGLRTVATAVAAEARPEAIFDLVCRQSKDLVDASAAALIRFEGADYEIVATSAAGDVALPPVGQTLDVRPGSEAERVRDGESVAVEDNIGHRIGELGFRAAVLVPVRVAGAVWGCLAVTWLEAHQKAADVEPWLREFSELVSVAIGNAQARSELSRRAATDPLTGLANLRTLHTALDSRVAFGRPRGGSVALALVDIDHFKRINDGFGHATGDAVLRTVAAELRAACREDDVAARVGGDEFALVLDSCDADAALRIAERVRARVHEATEAAQLPTVTISVGVSTWEPGLDREAIQRRADDAMYWAKLHGRDASWAYNAELMDASGAEQRTSALRRSGAVTDAAAVEASLRGAKTFWQSALDGLSKQIAVIGEDGRIIATNAAWRRFSEANDGDSTRTGVGVNYLDVCDAAVDDPVAAEVAASLRELLDGEREELAIDYGCHAPGRERWFTVRASRFGADRPRRVIVHHQEITDRRVAERRSAFQATLLDFIAMPVFAYDLERRVTYWNAASEALYGRAAADVLGKTVSDLGLLELPSDGGQLMREHLARHGSGEWELISIDAAGRRFATAVTVALVRDERGEPSGVIGTVFDLTERAAHQRELQSARDFLHTVTESIADGLLVIDGHGDVAYANTAARAMLADGDEIAGHPAGDVLYGGAAPTAAASELLDRHVGTRTSLDEFRRAGGARTPVEWTSAPLTTGGGTAADEETEGGGSRVIVFRDVTERRAHEDRLQREAEGLRWAKNLRDALEENRFELHAQPIVATATGAIVDHELLIRMRGRDGALIPPGDFLPAAEEHDLITEIDRWVTGQAVTFAATGMPVHFNLSARSIGDMDLLANLRRTIEQTGADPRRLTIELTETALLEDREQAAAFAHALRRLGCHVALDDFGAGYNSFARIKDVPADVIKIDRQFITDLLQDPASESVIRGILAFAADLGLRVIAEGVEDRPTVERLRDLGVPFAQGYHFGRPAPVDEVALGSVARRVVRPSPASTPASACSPRSRRP